MRVVVAAVKKNCPAHLALEREGVLHEVMLLDNDLGYSRMLTELWEDGEGFVLFEHDVVPWAGATEQLKTCESAWCQVPYPLFPSAVRCAMGCVKISDRVIGAHPELPVNWRNVFWRQLDGKFVPAVAGVAGRACVHEPAFAHVKG